MPFKLKHSETLSESFTRIACEEVDGIVAELRKKREDTAESVHESRKGIKKIRTLLRLMRGDLGSRNYQFENAFFRDAGHQLSDPRYDEGFNAAVIQ